MMHIGRPYNEKTWNCATCAMDYYNFPLEQGEEWGVEFLYYLKRHFRRTTTPQEGDLVVCKYTSTGGLHVGIWLNQGVYHAYRVLGRRGGDTVITCHNMFNFHDIRYYRLKGNGDD